MRPSNKPTASPYSSSFLSASRQTVPCRWLSAKGLLPRLRPCFASQAAHLWRSNSCVFARFAVLYFFVRGKAIGLLKNKEKVKKKVKTNEARPTPYMSDGENGSIRSLLVSPLFSAVNS